jgi:hypothetical protein
MARIPKEHRDAANLMLLDGEPYTAIITELEKRGFAGINEQNLTNWKDGGYQDWLKSNERLEQMRLLREQALDVVKDNEGSKVTEAALHLAAAQAYEILSDYDLSAFKDVLAEKPALYGKVVNGLAKISSEVLGYERFRTEVKKKLDEIKVASAKGGLTTETIERIERELNLL